MCNSTYYSVVSFLHQTVHQVNEIVCDAEIRRSCDDETEMVIHTRSDSSVK